VDKLPGRPIHQIDVITGIKQGYPIKASEWVVGQCWKVPDHGEILWFIMWSSSMRTARNSTTMVAKWTMRQPNGVQRSSKQSLEPMSVISSRPIRAMHFGDTVIGTNLSSRRLNKTMCLSAQYWDHKRPNVKRWFGRKVSMTTFGAVMATKVRPDYWIG